MAVTQYTGVWQVCETLSASAATAAQPWNLPPFWHSVHSCSL